MGALKVNSGIAFILLMGILLILFLAASLFLGLPIILAIIITAVIMFIQWWVSAWVVESSTKVKYLEPGENVFLERMVAEICERAEVRVPRLGIVQNRTPNAFVWGRTKRDMRLAVHTGLLEQLNKDEIRAVIGHEIGHIKHRDAQMMTFLSVIPLLAYLGAQLIWFGGGRSREGGAIIAFALVSLVVYIISQLIVLRFSRVREYYADAYSAEITGNPHALSSALVKITYGLSLAPKRGTGNARSFYIADGVAAAAEIHAIAEKKSQYDLNGDGVIDERELELALEQERGGGTWAELHSTHPPTHKRIQALRAIEEEMRTGTQFP
jgi:heat shock protein HtpX